MVFILLCCKRSFFTRASFLTFYDAFFGKTVKNCEAERQKLSFFEREIKIIRVVVLSCVCFAADRIFSFFVFKMSLSRLQPTNQPTVVYVYKQERNEALCFIEI